MTLSLPLLFLSLIYFLLQSENFMSHPWSTRRNASLGLCQCEKDDWRAVQKGLWRTAMSPYEERYVDVKFVGDTSGSVSIAVDEGLVPLVPCHVRFFTVLKFPLLILINCRFRRFTAMAPHVSSSWICFTIAGINCQQLGSFLL